MNLLVVGSDIQREELAVHALSNNGWQLQWVAEPASIDTHLSPDAVIDLLFENTEARIQLLKKLQAGLIVINSVIDPLSATEKNVVRINGWATFLKRPVIEAACANDQLQEKAEQMFSIFGKKTEWVPDIPGFITARVIASIVNEAYFALQENVSTREEIDIAMKLGTNYPYGPFEWSEKIGLKNIHSLLDRLAREQKRYEPAALLTKEAFT